jgi:hypothetical protein
MPKLSCPCGFAHNLTPIPDDGWITVRDREYEELIEAELEVQQNPTGSDRVVKYWGVLYECPDCGRIMWEKPGEERFTIYRRDE